MEKYGKDWMAGSPEAILELIRMKASYISISIDSEKESTPVLKEIEIPEVLQKRIKGWGTEKQKRQLKQLIAIENGGAVGNSLWPEIGEFIKEKEGEINPENLKSVMEFISEISSINIDEIREEIINTDIAPTVEVVVAVAPKAKAHLVPIPATIEAPPERGIEITQEGLIYHLNERWKPQIGFPEAYSHFIDLCMEYLGLTLPYFKSQLENKKRSRRVKEGLQWMKIALKYKKGSGDLNRAIKGKKFIQSRIGHRIIKDSMFRA